MASRYRENIYRCGKYLEIDVFPTFHKGGRKRRRAKYRPTSAMQERLNQRNAERALTRILNENFTSDDIEITLTYKDEYLPDTYAGAKRDADNFLRKVKRLRARRGLPEIKYVLVPGGGRYHFHIPMSGGIPRDELEALWGKGYANSRRLKFDENGIAGLANYISNQREDDEFLGEDLFSKYDINEETGELIERDRKRRKGERRYTCSRNIKRPEPEIKEGRISKARVEELASFDSESKKAFERMYPGYTLSRCEPYYNDENGGWYLHIRMYSTEGLYGRGRPN